MKKLTAGILMLSIIVCIGFAFGAAGSQSDPLISKDYIENTFKKDMSQKGDAIINSALGGVFDSAVNALNDKVLGGSKYRYAEGYETVSLEKDESVTVYTGSSVILTSGNVKLSALNGAVVNISDASSLKSGASLSKSARYFCAENTQASYTASSNAKIMVSGYYSSTAQTDDPGVDAPVIDNPDLREFNENTFSDVSRDDWYYNAVGFVYSNYIFNGVSATEFGVDVAITRADFVTALYRLAGKPSVSGTSTFTDVTDSSAYYYDPVIWAAKNGIVLGYDDGRFDPTTKINREQMMAFIYRYAKVNGADMTIASTSKYDAFTDKDKVSSWAVDSVKWCIECSVVNGSGGKILPAGGAQRCQVAQVILNLTEHVN